MTTQVQFGEYVFPLPQNMDDNFLNFVPSTDRMPGMGDGITMVQGWRHRRSGMSR